MKFVLALSLLVLTATASAQCPNGMCHTRNVRAWSTFVDSAPTVTTVMVQAPTKKFATVQFTRRVLFPRIHSFITGR